jgi:hypothetical protein
MRERESVSVYSRCRRLLSNRSPLQKEQTRPYAMNTSVPCPTAVFLAWKPLYSPEQHETASARAARSPCPAV